MFQIIKILLLVLLPFVSAIGQISKSQLGIEGGPSLSIQRDGAYRISNNPTIGGIVGITFEYNFSKNLSVRSSLSYERKGVQYQNESPNISGTIYSYFDYINLPILLRVYLDKGNHLFVNGGPYFGYLINQVDIFKGEHSSYEMWSYQHIDLGMTIGIGGCFKIFGNMRMSIELRDLLGLYNISKYDNRGNPVSPEEKTLNNSTIFLIGLNYTFNNKIANK